MVKPVDLNKISISYDETHHLYENKPLYNARFKKVMSFHPPGIAPVVDDTGAFHIDLMGNPIYDTRFLKTYGFYCGLAAVETPRGWTHINSNGDRTYLHFYDWVGNFQENYCVVRNKEKRYFHILPNGDSLYKQRYEYVGDYRHGIAVVKDEDGIAYHIDNQGNKLYQSSYFELDVFHKGFARAKDQYGWCHVNKQGNPIYKERYLSVEPFYNGNALVKKFSGEMGIINEDGIWIKSLNESSSPPKEVKKYYQDLLVSYWKSQTIYTAVKLNILEHLSKKSSKIQDLANELNLNSDALKRLLKALQALGIIIYENEYLKLTSEGHLFTEDHPSTLKFASLVWGDEHYLSWHYLPQAIRTGMAGFETHFGKNFFDWLNDHPRKLEIYHKAIADYANQDYKNLLKIHDFSGHRRILDLGGGIGILLSFILEKNKELKGFLLENPSVIRLASKFLKNERLLSRCQLIPGSFFDKIPFKYDAIIMSRILHDWNDAKCQIILQNCYDALNKNGILYIIEIIYPDTISVDKGVLLNLNMLVVTGGRERTKDEFNNILRKGRFLLKEIKPINSFLSLLIATKMKK